MTKTTTSITTPITTTLMGFDTMEINLFIFNVEHFLSDIRGPRYFHLKKVYFFVGMIS